MSLWFTENTLHRLNYTVCINLLNIALFWEIIQNKNYHLRYAENKAVGETCGSLNIHLSRIYIRVSSSFAVRP